MHAVLFVYQRAFTPELIIQRPVRIRVGTPEIPTNSPDKAGRVFLPVTDENPVTPATCPFR